MGETGFSRYLLEQLSTHPVENVVAARELEAGFDRPVYDASGWPLFVVSMPPVALSAEAFQAHLEACRAPYRRMQPFVMLIDMGQHPPLSAERRKAVSEAMMSDNARYPGVHRALAIVVRSRFERGIITAISWVAKPPYPFAAFTTVGEAKAWLLEKL